MGQSWALTHRATVQWCEYIHQNCDLTKLCTPTIYFLLRYLLRRCVSKFIIWMLIILCADGMITLLLLSVQMWTQRMLFFSMAMKNDDLPRLILMICLKSQPWVAWHKTWRGYVAEWGFLSGWEANELTAAGLTPDSQICLKSPLNCQEKKPLPDTRARTRGSPMLGESVSVRSAVASACDFSHQTDTNC